MRQFDMRHRLGLTALLLISAFVAPAVGAEKIPYCYGNFSFSCGFTKLPMIQKPSPPVAPSPTAAQTRKEIAAQYERANQDCRNKFPTVTPQTIVANVECLNRAQVITQPNWGNNWDLIQTWMSYRAVIAERIQNNKMTVTEGIAEIRQRWSELQTEVQRRNAYAAQADAARGAAQQSAQQNVTAAIKNWEVENAIAEGNERRQNAIAAQQNAVDRANDIAEAQMYINAFQSLKPAPTPRLQTTCMQNGNFTYCH
jgi:hypothetical protein